ncbi:MAG: hypothetical protein Q8P18_15380 [Pseudomonadota bacterium]|nr:hypothetical protein [Pseudomonadota bacterium]
MLTTLALAALATPALASDLTSSLWHPGAGGMEKGFSYVGTTVLMAAGPDYAGTWVGATAAWAPTKRLSVSGTGLVAVGSTVAAAGVRFNIIESKWFRGGPVAFGAAWDHTENEASQAIGGGLGLAVESGFSRVRFDTFVPLVVVTSGQGPLSPADRLPGFDHWNVGMTIRMGGSHANRLRGGVSSGGASFAYQHVGERWFMESAMTVGMTPTVSGSLRGGFVF